jgi:hypothetical protein
MAHMGDNSPVGQCPALSANLCQLQWPRYQLHGSVGFSIKRSGEKNACNYINTHIQADMLLKQYVLKSHVLVSCLGCGNCFQQSDFIHNKFLGFLLGAQLTQWLHNLSQSKQLCMTFLQRRNYAQAGCSCVLWETLPISAQPGWMKSQLL